MYKEFGPADAVLTFIGTLLVIALTADFLHLKPLAIAASLIAASATTYALFVIGREL